MTKITASILYYDCHDNHKCDATIWSITIVINCTPRDIIYIPSSVIYDYSTGFVMVTYNCHL